MKAMIFAAGVGSRLKPYTDSHPKALVDVGGKPMLRRVIDRLTAAGADDITVNVHHFAEQIKNYLKTESESIPACIHISDESDRLLDTGGGILKAADFLTRGEAGPIIVHNADILSTVDLRDMLQGHIESGADVTLLTADRETSRKLLFDKHGRMRGWTNVSTDEIRLGASQEGHIEPDKLIPLAFGGIHIITPKIFPLLKHFAADDNKFSIIPFYIENAGKLNIRAYCPPSSSYSWYDIGKPATLEKARLWLAAHDIHFL